MKALIFDMDGVLVDTEPHYAGINLRLFSELGVGLSEEEHMQRFVGVSPPDQWAQLKTEFGLADPVDTLVERELSAQVAEFTNLESVSPVPGIPELIAAAGARNVKLAVGSSSVRRVVDILLARCGLADHFEITVSGDDVERGKPAPDIFLKVASMLGVDPEECIVIEDSAHGVAAADYAGMVTVGFQNPNSGNQDLSDAHVTVPSFDEFHRQRILDLI